MKIIYAIFSIGLQIEKERLFGTSGSMNVYYNQRKGGVEPFGLTAKTAKGGGIKYVKVKKPKRLTKSCHTVYDTGHLFTYYHSKDRPLMTSLNFQVSS